MLAVATPSGSQDTKKDPTQAASIHFDSWANLMYETQRFYYDLTRAAHKDPQTGLAFDTTGEVTDALQFRSPVANLADYHFDGDTLRYCLTSLTGEFYATTETEPRTDTSPHTTVIGVGDCDYEDGSIVTTEDGIQKGKDLLDAVQPFYERLAKAGGPLGTRGVEEVLDGTHRDLAVATHNAGVAVEDYAQHHGGQPATLTRRVLADIGYDLPDGIRVGWYDNRSIVGYRFCLTDGTEEAVFESSQDRVAIIRHSTGTCREP